MARIDNITLTSELEAVNAVLGAVGEAPLEDIEATGSADVEMTISILRENTRAVQAEGWRFNTLLGLDLPPYDTFDWTDADGMVTSLNVFTPPDGVTLLDVRPANVDRMVGVDFVLTAPILYGGDEVPTVLFDRATNRDGFPEDRFPTLTVDAIRLVSFSQIPQEARQYIVIRSARQYAQQVVGSAELSSFAERDEIQALRKLKRAHGEQEDFNIFNNTDVLNAVGGRPRALGVPLFRQPANGVWR